jgi:flavin-dependent dehydrogenase
MRTDFDAVIVGAGPAGSAAAGLLARGGWRVALVEKQRFPRRKVCGECLAASNLPLLDALGIGSAFAAAAGADLRQVALMRGEREVLADLPPADHPRHHWGRALGRETLDSLLRDAAAAAGVQVLQPWTVKSISGTPGVWQCELRSVETASVQSLRARVAIDAHGSWEDLPSSRQRQRSAHSAADLLAFKANFLGTSLSAGVISVLALDGGYGGMVVADHGVTTVACCIRRDRLHALRSASPGVRAGDAVQAWLTAQCGGVRRALQDATLVEPWLTCGPIDPGTRQLADDGILRVGNAAGEAHPILGEGMSMALQSAALLCSQLLGAGRAIESANQTWQGLVAEHYAAEWQRQFGARLHLAAAFAQASMRPSSGALLMAIAQAWPGLLTQGARWGGKLRLAADPKQLDQLRSVATQTAESNPVTPSASRAN